MSYASIAPAFAYKARPPRAVAEVPEDPPALVSRWTFDETSGQTVADAQSLSAASGVSLERNLDTIVVGGSKSCGFNGTGSKAEAPHVGAWLLSSYSIVAYVQPDALPASGQNWIIADKDDGLPAGGWSLEIDHDGSTVNFRAAVRDSGGGGGSATFVRSTTAVVAGTAYRVVLTVDEEDGAALYVDDGAAEDTDATRTQGMQANTSNLFVGAYGGAVAFLDGVLKHLEIHDSALNQTQVEALPDATSITHEDEAPEPASFACLLRTTGTLVETFKDLGELAGTAGGLKPVTGTNARYDFTGTGKSIPLANAPPTGGQDDWAGNRCLIRLDTNNGAAAHDGACFSGGYIICPNMLANYEWGSLYDSTNQPRPSIHIRGQGLHNLLFEGFRAHGAGWDAVGISDLSGSKTGISNLTFRKMAVTLQRDDCFESDTWTDGVLVDDCLLEGMVLFSCNNTGFDGSARSTTIQNCQCYTLPVRLDGVSNRISARYLKLDSRSVRLRLIDNIFAVPDHDSIQGDDLDMGPFRDLVKFSKMHPDSEGNTICWLGSGSYPFDNPDSDRFTILTGATASTFWAAALADFWATFPGHRFSFDPEAP